VYTDIRLSTRITTFEAPPYFEREQTFMTHRSGVHQFMTNPGAEIARPSRTLRAQNEKPNVLCMISDKTLTMEEWKVRYCTRKLGDLRCPSWPPGRVTMRVVSRWRLRSAVASSMSPKMYVNYVDRTFSPLNCRFLAPPRFSKILNKLLDFETN
jgi:hypothetical protein